MKDFTLPRKIKLISRDSYPLPPVFQRFVKIRPYLIDKIVQLGDGLLAVILPHSPHSPLHCYASFSQFGLLAVNPHQASFSPRSGHIVKIGSHPIVGIVM